MDRIVALKAHSGPAQLAIDEDALAMTQARATDSSRTGFLFDGWRPRVLATLGYLLTIAGLLAVAITGTDSHGGVATRQPSGQAVSAPTSASTPSGPQLAVLELASDLP